MHGVAMAVSGVNTAIIRRRVKVEFTCVHSQLSPERGRSRTPRPSTCVSCMLRITTSRIFGIQFVFTGFHIIMQIISTVEVGVQNNYWREIYK